MQENFCFQKPGTNLETLTKENGPKISFPWADRKNKILLDLLKEIIFLSVTNIVYHIMHHHILQAKETLTLIVLEIAKIEGGILIKRKICVYKGI